MANQEARQAGRESKTERDIDALKEDLAKLRADLGALTDHLREVAGAEGARAYERIRQGAERTQARAKEATTAASHQIEERPLTSVLVAFAVGLLSGLLLSRRS